MRMFREFSRNYARTLTAGLLTAVLFGGICPLAAWSAETFSLEIGVANATYDLLKLGLDDEATDGFDPLDIPFPYGPPGDVSDITFKSGDMRTIVDYRQAADAKEWPLTASVVSGSTISLSWTSPGTTGFMAGKGLTLTGQGLNVDMVAETSAQITAGGDYAITLGAKNASGLLTPSGTVTEKRPEFTWDAIAGATWYNVYIQQKDGWTWDTWVQTNSWQSTQWDFDEADYEWWIQPWSEAGGNGEWSAGLTFTVDVPEFGVPTLEAPTGTVTEVAPTFTWSAVTGATWYQLWITKAGPSGWDWTKWIGSDTEWTTTQWDFDDGEYTWWVQAWGTAQGAGAWSEGLSFTVSLASRVPTPLAPIGALADAPRPEFSWSSVSGASWYQLYIQKIGSWQWDTWIQNDTTWTSTLWDFDAGSYTWWVKSWSDSGGESAWSEGVNFTLTIASNLPGDTAPIAPSGTVTEARPEFSWEPSTGATWYSVYIQQQGGWTWDFWVEGTTTWTSADYNFVNDNYEWWVRPWNNDGYGSWSSGMTFTKE